MSIDARLNKLMPVLTARERAILILRALQHGTPEDPSWRLTMPREQSAQFNHYICLMNACSIHLPLYITMVEQHTELLWQRLHRTLNLIQSGRQIWELGKLIPPSKLSEAEKLMQSSYPAVEFPWDGEEHEHSWLTVVENMHKGMRAWLVSLWQELRSIDIVVSEVAAEFEGEDPLRPVMRSVLEKARRDLTLLQEAFDQLEPLELTEPDEDTMTLARKHFDNGYRLMSRL